MGDAPSSADDAPTMSQSQSTTSSSLEHDVKPRDPPTVAAAASDDLHDKETGSTFDGQPRSEQPVVSPSPDGDPSQAVPARYSSFSLWEKRLIVLAASLSAFFSPLTAQIYFPALNVVADAFNVSITQINLTVTTYMIFQGITPMFIGGLADTAGRRPAYIICFVVRPSPIPSDPPGPNSILTRTRSMLPPISASPGARTTQS